jgi:hypothetical protein
MLATGSSQLGASSNGMNTSEMNKSGSTMAFVVGGAASASRIIPVTARPRLLKQAAPTITVTIAAGSVLSGMSTP